VKNLISCPVFLNTLRKQHSIRHNLIKHLQYSQGGEGVETGRTSASFVPLQAFLLGHKQLAFSLTYSKK